MAVDLSKIMRRMKETEAKETPASKPEIKQEVKEEPQEQPVSKKQTVSTEEGSEGQASIDISQASGETGYKAIKIFGEAKAGVGKHLISNELVEKIKKVNEVYPLITLNINKKDYTFAWANIRWNPQLNALVYYVNEPKLTKEEEVILSDAKRILQEKLDISFAKIRKEEAYDYLMEKFRKLMKEMNYKITPEARLKLEYFMYRDFVGLGNVEPMMHDPNIEDVSCDGINIPLFIYHRNPIYGEIQTNVVFEDKIGVDAFVMKLAQKCARSISIAQPLLDGALPDGSRVQATLGTDIAMRGSNFTIRKFTKEPITPITEMNFGTGNAEIMAYLWLAIENRLSVLVAGPTATGKTSFLNAMSLFIKSELKIISIEDTAELRLPHPNWIPEVARASFGKGGYGEVSMFDLLKASLRQRPDYIIVGEVRGEEAYVMFQGMATGHPSLGTLHADSLNAIVDRLTTKPISLPKALIQNLDVVVFLVLTKIGGEYIRRVKEIVEIIGYDYKTKSLVTNTAWTWKPEKDEYVHTKSIILDKIRERMGYSIDDLKQDLANRIKVLEWLQKNNVTNYKEVAVYLKTYYSNPQYITKLVLQGGSPNQLKGENV
ncbi:MAG: type II/IV secretion system ATPase subunit [Candidatus Nanoarchaeia archaeon]|nr:type II/IV secretion system ATPase subunit [Candidatus Nanoarchaeia archaeon]